MERLLEMAELVKDFRIARVTMKRRFLNEKIVIISQHFLDKFNSLVKMQNIETKTRLDKPINRIYFCRLHTSSYTESNEIFIGMNDSVPFLGEHINYLFWTPLIIFESIVKDMNEVEKLLRKKYTKVEEYELLYVKRMLLDDDWKLFCELLKKLMYKCQSRILSSGLAMDKEVQVLCGDYMDNLELVCIITAEGSLISEK